MLLSKKKRRTAKAIMATRIIAEEEKIFQKSKRIQMNKVVNIETRNASLKPLSGDSILRL